MRVCEVYVGGEMLVGVEALMESLQSLVGADSYTVNEVLPALWLVMLV